MAPSDTSNKKNGSQNLPANELNSKAISEQLDLDKNPIKFATHEPGKFQTDSHDKSYMELTLRSGDHAPIMQKLLRQRIEQRAAEFPRWPGSQTSGVRVMWIESRFWYDRERLSPDFDQDWRLYRAKYLHSLELDPREPVHVPEYEIELINPIRRCYMKVGDWLENNIIAKFTNDKIKSATYRVVFTRGLMIYASCIGLYYYLRNHHDRWEQIKGPILSVSRPMVYPSHPNYPFRDPRIEPGHHYDQGFSKRKIFKDLRDYEDKTVVL